MKQEARLAEDSSSFLKYCKPVKRQVRTKALAGSEPRQVDKATFTRASTRVDFALIERRHEIGSGDTVDQVARLNARAVRRMLQTDRVEEKLANADEIGGMSFESSDVGKIKAALKEGLGRAWNTGTDSAAKEMIRARQPAQFALKKTLHDKAAEYFEGNGFRMAANLTDGMRGIIQAELLLGVKNGLRSAEVVPKIYDRLIRKGFLTLSAVEREENREDILASLNALLQDVLDTANVPAYLATLVRTNTFEALNEARYAFFEDPVNEGFVVAYEYAATLDDRTTEICQSLDDSIYAQGSEVWDQYRPPNHYNCRSLLIPITLTDEWDGVESPPPTVLPQEGFK